MQDYDTILKIARRLRFEEDQSGYFLHRLSNLPEAKINIKNGIKERIRELCGAYIALSSYIPDEDADYVAGLRGKPSGRRLKRIFRNVLREMKSLENEIREFDPFKH